MTRVKCKYVVVMGDGDSLTVILEGVYETKKEGFDWIDENGVTGEVYGVMPEPRMFVLEEPKKKRKLVPVPF